MVDPDTLLADALAQVDAAPDLAALEDVRIATVGRNAPLPLALRDVGTLPPDERGEAGKRLNIARQQIEARLTERQALLESSALADTLANDRIDVTLPGRAMPHGGLHVLTQTRREIEQIFLDMGYLIAEGPEVETEFNNFTALNIPDDHPAKADSDTLVAIICPGRVYRRDTQDATHSPNFQQVEGLLIDEGVTLAHLKGTLDHLTKKLFGADREIRLRSGFFPFTEPSIEVDVSWGDGWMEILGAGMVDPNVLEHVGYDSERYTGFAFGVGIERVAMLRHGIPDIRMLYDNDVRFFSSL